MIYFIADTHFNEKNIIKYSNRPFNDIEEMNEQIINNWNRKVHRTDTVFILGDITTDYDYLKRILSLLNGNIYLVKGNHDTFSNESYRKAGIKEVYDYPIIVEDFYILSHEPLYINETMPYLNIFGHVHNNPIYKDYSPNSYCVSVERINYTPISLDMIKQRIENY